MVMWNKRGIGVYLLLAAASVSGQSVLERIVALDFGEPTRDCAGRGQLCQITPLMLDAGEIPFTDAIGILRLDSTGCWELKVQASSYLPPDPLSEDSLYLPQPFGLLDFPERDTTHWPDIPAGTFFIHSEAGWKRIRFTAPNPKK